MAIFNPAVDPTRAQPYRESRDVVPGTNILPRGQEANTIQPTGVRHVDTSGQLAYMGAAQSIEGAGKLGALFAHEADTGVKDYLSEKLFTDLNNEREAYTAALRVVKGATGARGGGGSASLDEVANDQGDIAGGDGGTDIIASQSHGNPDVYRSDPDNPPDEVAAVPQKLGQLVAARGAGKISPTEYLARQNAILKDVRYNWSGWREYIDREASQILGGNVANMYIRSMMHDINAGSGTAKADPQHARDVAYATQNIGLLYGTTLHQDVVNQVPGAAAKMYAYTAPYAASEEALKAAKMRRENATGTEEARVKLADAETDQAMNTIVMKNFNTVFKDGKSPDLGTSGPSGQQVSDFVTKFQATGAVLPPEQARALSQINQALKAKARAELMEYGNKPGANGRTLIQDSGGQIKYTQKVEDQLKIYDVVHNALIDKDYGLIPGAANAVSDANDSTAKALYDSDIGVWLKTSAAIVKMGGPNNAFGKLINTEAMSEIGGSQIAGFINQRKKEMITQPDLQTKGSFVTLNGSIEEAKNKKKLIPDMPDTINKFVSLVEKIPNKEYPDEAKVGLVQAIFSPENRKTLSHFEAEGSTDPVTGRPVTNGKFSVFERLAQKDVADEVARLDKAQPHLGLLRMYKDTNESYFAKDLIGREVQNVNQLDKTMFKGATLKYSGTDVSGGPRIDLKFSTNENPFAQAQAQGAVDRINRSLKAMVNVGAVSGKTVDEYLFGVLTAAGYNAKGPITGFPEMLVKGIIGSTDEALKEQERIRSKYRTGTETTPPAALPPLSPRTRLNPTIGIQ